MNFKRINPIILAEALAGLQGEPGENLRRELGAKPQLVEMYWWLQSLRTDELNALVDRVAPKRRGNYLTEDDQLAATLRFLAGEAFVLLESGKCSEAIAAAIQKEMELQAKAARVSLADTKVSRAILKELDLAIQHRVPVPIIGDSRFGKTKAVSVWKSMCPGRARMVTVPPSNRDFDFFAAHADAFGIEYGDRTPAPRLKRQVEYVMQRNGMFVIYDEAHFLVPIGYHKDTPPKRINWVRCEVIDKGIGCAFFATPQSMNQTLEKFAAKTKYNFEQWLGRLAPPLVLADYYDRDELMAVAKVHFPDFDEDLIALICARAMQSEGYLKSMEFTARYASALAQDRRHRTPTEKDVDEAIERMMPRKTLPAAPPLGSGSKARSRVLKPALTTISEPAEASLALPARNTRFAPAKAGKPLDREIMPAASPERDLAPA